MEVKVTDNSEIFRKAKNNAIKRALEAIGMTAERYAKERCPVDTGRLRNSITHGVSGEAPAIKMYKASYGSNRDKNGKRYSASSKNAGEVAVGFYSGKLPQEPENKRAVYIGSNVEYAKHVEVGNAKHKSGANHFLRDAASKHGDEYKRIAEKNLKNADIDFL